MGEARDTSAAVETALDALRFRTALDQLDAVFEGAPREFLLRARALYGLERFGEACDDALRVADSALPPELRADALVLSLSARSRIEGWDEQHLVHIERAIELASGAGEDGREALGRARLERARQLARHGARELAERELSAARELLGESPPLVEMEGRLLLFFDERLEAQQVYARALSSGAEREGRLGMSRVCRLLGDFAAAEKALDDFAWSDEDLAPLRARAAVAEAEENWQELVEVLERALSISPFGGFALDDRSRRAAALFRLGERERAARAYREIVDGARDGRDSRVREARRLSSVLSSDQGGKRARLKAFPTVAQLRNHCGPASCELYLRYFGIDAEQASIGRDILYENSGTSIYRMRAVLEKAGLATRRIEAELPSVRQLIDLGIPIIIEETYSQSGHAAVVIGYDDVRAVIEVQDPMTHAVRQTPYSELDSLLDFTNAGGLVGVPAGDERLSALDEAGIVECRYISLVDEALAALDDERYDAVEPLLDQSMELRRDYEIQWCCRFDCAAQRLDEEPSAAHRAALHRVVGEALAIWPDDEWARRFSARVAFEEERYDDALADYRRAMQDDPYDARNWVGIGRCHFRMEEVGPARRAFGRALDCDPGSEAAIELLAYMALLDGSLELSGPLGEIALSLRPDSAFDHLVRADQLLAEHEPAAALVQFERALELDPSRAASVLMRRVDALAKLGRHAEAAVLLDEPAEGVPEPVLLERRIEAVRKAGESERALSDARALSGIDGWEGTGMALTGSVLLDLGQFDEAESALKEAMGLDVGCALAHHDLGRLYASRGQTQAALPAFAFAVALDPDEPRYNFLFGRLLVDLGAYELATPYIVHAARSATLDEGQLGYAAWVIAQGRGPRAALDVLRGMHETADPATLKKALHAETRLLSQVFWAPGALADSLRKLHALDPDDPFGLAQAGADRFERSIEDELEGERMLVRAQELLAEAGEPDNPLPKRLLATRLLSIGRAGEVLELIGDGSERADVDLRVDALVQLERYDEAEELIGSFERGDAEDEDDEDAEPDEPEIDAALRYSVARGRSDFERALELARAAGEDAGEDADDARADPWELSQFECLLALGRDEEAIQFAMDQGGDSASLGELCHRALLAGRPRAARSLAELALRADEREAYAIHALGRIAELGGDLESAREHYYRAGEADGEWHAWLEELARLSISTGDAQAAVEYAERAVRQDGHTCFWAVGARAQAYLLSGKLEQAVADAKRALAIGPIHSRDRVGLDVWGIAALLTGDKQRGEELLARYLADEEQSGPLDRQRIERLTDAHQTFCS